MAKRKRGRPKIPQNRRKSAELRASCTPALLAEVREQANKLGVSVPDFIRQAVESWV